MAVNRMKRKKGKYFMEGTTVIRAITPTMSG